MSKLGIKELSSSLSDKHGLNKNDAEKFVAAIFDVINEGLETDKLVKVKGLGTFKIVGVAARKSVDVNTGEPIVIEGRDKISFTPDATLRDEVNKPFSQFDTVVLNEGVDFSSIDKAFEADPEAAVRKAIGNNRVSETPAFNDTITEVPVAEENTEVEGTAESVVPSAEEKIAEEKIAEEKIAEENIAEETIAEETIAEEPSKNETTTENHFQAEEQNVTEKPVELEKQDSEDKKEEQPLGEDEDVVEEHQNNTLRVLIVAAAIIVMGCIGGGYYLFKQIEKRDSHIALLEKQMKIVAQNQKKNNVAQLRHPSPNKAVVTPQAPAVSQSEHVDSPKASRERMAQEKSLQAKYNQDPRIRTGAYVITGIKRTVTVRAGQTLDGISRKELGPGMECYVEAVNGGQRELKAGEKINIPSLRLKKKLK